MNKKERGITLIALVVTIVILIILATISINTVMGEDGLIKRAEKAAEHQANAEAADSEAMEEYNKHLANVMYEESEKELIEFKIVMLENGESGDVIQETICYAEKDMTWEDWVKRPDLNTIGATLDLDEASNYEYIKVNIEGTDYWIWMRTWGVVGAPVATEKIGEIPENWYYFFNDRMIEATPDL